MPTYDVNNVFSLSIDAAIQAGHYLKKNFYRKPKVEYKGEINLITERDRKSQYIIYQMIKKKYPHHSILGEEDLDIKNESEFLWIIDPLDGTTNYAHSLPIFCISIAFQYQGITQVGVVFNPMINEMFRAVKGKKAFVNKRRLKVSSENRLDSSLLATGFPYDLRQSKDNNLNHFNQFIFKCRGIRRCGAAAIDLSYTAAGRFDGFWELKLHPWDTAAGALIVEESGGIITDFCGNLFDPFKMECLASNGKIHEQMLKIIQSTTKAKLNT